MMLRRPAREILLLLPSSSVGEGTGGGGGGGVGFTLGAFMLGAFTLGARTDDAASSVTRVVVSLSGLVIFRGRSVWVSLRRKDFFFSISVMDFCFS